MASWSESEAKTLASDILMRLRTKLQRASADGITIGGRRSPSWVEAARVRAGWIGPTLVMVFEEAPSATPRNDSFQILGPVHADTAVLLDRPGLQPVGWTRDALRFADRLTEASYGEGVAPTLVLPHNSGWQHTRPYPRHGTLAVFGICFQMDAGPTDQTPGFTRVVPAALYVSKLGAQALDDVANWFADGMVTEIDRFAKSSAGTEADARRTRTEAFATSKERSVIVLGSYADAEGDELARVRDYLRQKGYDAALISEFPDVPMQSLVEKVRMWTGAARFCVMIDRKPAGHIREYGILREQATILALLRPRGQGSTYMIGDDHLVDVNYFRVFEFTTSPLQELDEAVRWAEELVRQREVKYGAYPWRGRSA